MTGNTRQGGQWERNHQKNLVYCYKKGEAYTRVTFVLYLPHYIWILNPLKPVTSGQLLSWTYDVYFQPKKEVHKHRAKTKKGKANVPIAPRRFN